MANLDEAVALANRLVGQPYDAAAIEITLGPAEFRADQAMAVAVTGAPCQVEVNGEEVEPHHTLHLKAGDTLTVAGTITARGGAGDGEHGGVETGLKALRKSQCITHSPPSMATPAASAKWATAWQNTSARWP